MSDCEPFAQVTQKEWAIVSKLVRSLTKNERMSKSLTFCANGSFAHFFGKKQWIAPKFDEHIPSPAYNAMMSLNFQKVFIFLVFFIVGINLENYLLLLVLLRKNKDHFNKEKDFVLNIPPLIPIKFLYIVCTL